MKNCFELVLIDNNPSRKSISQTAKLQNCKLKPNIHLTFERLVLVFKIFQKLWILWFTFQLETFLPSKYFNSVKFFLESLIDENRCNPKSNQLSSRTKLVVAVFSLHTGWETWKKCVWILSNKRLHIIGHPGWLPITKINYMNSSDAFRWTWARTLLSSWLI